MKVVILAGGLGTRISEETGVLPKPMVEIGGQPILWHIMKIYFHYGFDEFVVCLGHKGHVIREYFINCHSRNSDLTVYPCGAVEMHKCATAFFKTVTLVDTGKDTMTGGRIKAISKYIDNETFMLTYGDGVADVNLNRLLAFHRDHGRLCTATAIQPAGRFGALEIGADDIVEQFAEKPKGSESWVNAGFFVCEPGVLDYIGDSPDTVFEREPLERLASDGQLCAYRHSGFWKCMDTMNDKMQLEHLGQTDPKWKVWA